MEQPLPAKSDEMYDLLTCWLRRMLKGSGISRILVSLVSLISFCAQVTRLCPLEEVPMTQLDNTNILSNCTVCLRALSKAGGAWYCDRCWRFPNLCSLCHRVVKGLYVWCQG